MPHQCTNCSHVFPDGSKAMLSGCPDCGGNTFQFLPKGAVPAADVENDTPSDSSAESGTDTVSDDLPVESAEPTQPADATEPADSTASPEKLPSRGPVGRATAAVREWMRIDSPSPTPRPEEATRADSVESENSEETDVEADRGGEFAFEDDTTDSPTDSTGNIANEERPPANADTDSDVPTDADDAGIGIGSEDHAQADVRRDVATDDDLPSPSDAAGPDSLTPPSGAEGGRIAAEPSGDRPDLDELRRELNDQFESIKIVAPGQYELNLMELYNREEYIIALREDGRYAIEAPETWLGRRADRD